MSSMICMSSIFSISFNLFSIVMLLDVIDVVVLLWLVVGMGVVLVVGVWVVLVVGLGVILVVRQVGNVYVKAIDCIKAINSFEDEFLLPHYIDISFAR